MGGTGTCEEWPVAALERMGGSKGREQDGKEWAVHLVWILMVVKHT